MKFPSILKVYDVQRWTTATMMEGRGVPARPMGYPSFISRCKTTLLVFCGKADALVWPEDQ